MLALWIFFTICGILMIIFPQVFWEMQKFSHPRKFEGDMPVVFMWITRFIGIVLIVVSIVGIF